MFNDYEDIQRLEMRQIFSSRPLGYQPPLTAENYPYRPPSFNLPRLPPPPLWSIPLPRRKFPYGHDEESCLRIAAGIAKAVRLVVKREIERLKKKKDSSGGLSEKDSIMLESHLQFLRDGQEDDD